jgi:hypothetical protein
MNIRNVLSNISLFIFWIVEKETYSTIWDLYDWQNLYVQIEKFLQKFFIIVKNCIYLYIYLYSYARRSTS